MVTCSGVKLEARAIMALGLNENRIRSFLISRIFERIRKVFLKQITRAELISFEDDFAKSLL